MRSKMMKPFYDMKCGEIFCGTEYENQNNVLDNKYRIVKLRTIIFNAVKNLSPKRAPAKGS